MIVDLTAGFALGVLFGFLGGFVVTRILEHRIHHLFPFERTQKRD